MRGLPTVRAVELGHGGRAGAQQQEREFAGIARRRVAGRGDFYPDLRADHAFGPGAAGRGGLVGVAQRVPQPLGEIDFKALSANVAALKTRAMVVHFTPPASEILAKIKTFAGDAEIVGFLEQFREAMADFSLRTYRILEDLKQAGLDWRRYALNETNIPPKVIEIADLIVRFNTDIERVKHYSGSRRDYYNWKQAALEYLHRRSIANLGKEFGGITAA
ncbi:MAG: hypothetical protein ACE5EQ_06770 [Phycisphaerae bacterium]